jgi:Tfp pilus assembly protein PilF
MKNSQVCLCIVTITIPWLLGCAQEQGGILSTSPRISSQTRYAAGNMLERQNDFPGAIKQYQKAIETDPHMVEAFNRLGTVYMKLNRLDDAQQTFKQAIEENPESATLRNNFGFCCLQRRNYAGAQQQFDAALALSPDDTRARVNLAITLARLGQFTQSAAEFSRVLPADVAYCNVAAVCADMHDYRNALWALERALEENPACEVAGDNIDTVRRLARREMEQSSPLHPEKEAATSVGALPHEPEPVSAAPAPARQRHAGDPARVVRPAWSAGDNAAAD